MSHKKGNEIFLMESGNMITGIKAKNKNNLVWGINQLLGPGIRQKPLIVKICSSEGALVLLLAALDLCYIE